MVPNNFHLSDRSTPPSRRQLLAALGVGTAGALAGCGSLTGSGAETLGQTAKFVPDDGDEDDSFGESVALSADGRTAVVGADRDEDNGRWAGSAYVFTAATDGWTQQAKLVPDDGGPDERFGYSVAISGDGTTVIVGIGDEEGPGAAGPSHEIAYVFEATDGGWTQRAKLAPYDDSHDTNVDGTPVALAADGRTALLGHPWARTADGDPVGAVTVVERTDETWTPTTTLSVNDPQQSFSFGESVALSADGTTAVIGDSDALVDADKTSGSAHVFTRTGDRWQQEARLRPETGADLFGDAVSLSADGSTALVGAPLGGDNLRDFGPGWAYVFHDTDGWARGHKLVASDGNVGHETDRFGDAVALADDGTTAVVGAVHDSHPNGRAAGSAYVFRAGADGWTQQAKLAADDGEPHDFFGNSVAVSGDGSTVLVGAEDAAAPDGLRTGAVYAFSP